MKFYIHYNVAAKIKPAVENIKALRLPVRHVAVSLLMVSTMLSGCRSLPISAPTSHAIVKASQSAQNTLNYKIVELDPAVAAAAPFHSEVGLTQMAAFSASATPDRSDMILAGDDLIVSVFEVGVSLFGNSASAQLAPSAPGTTPSAVAHNIPVTVREDGYVTLPYIGRMKATGYYPEQLADHIRVLLSPYSQTPQVQVMIADSLSNAAYVFGGVVKSGRYRLTSAHEHVLDLIALAGGNAIDVNDAELHFTRQGQSATVSLADLRAESPSNIQVLPGDRIEIRKQRRSITVFGATNHVSEITFDAARLTLAEAIARSTGPADSRADARGVYLFRMEKDLATDTVKPVIYHINMLNPQSYFLAQMFQMQDKDAILYANSPSNVTQKFVGMINMLFSPALGVRYAAQ